MGICILKTIFIIVALIASILLIYIGPVIEKYYIIATSEPAYSYMNEDLDESIVCANKLFGIKISRPIIRVRKYESDGIHGRAHMDLNIIILAPFASYETIAHELGHIIDAQTLRKGHPDLEKMENFSIQEFADAIKDMILNNCGT